MPSLLVTNGNPHRETILKVFHIHSFLGNNRPHLFVFEGLHFPVVLCVSYTGSAV